MFLKGILSRFQRKEPTLTADNLMSLTRQELIALASSDLCLKIKRGASKKAIALKILRTLEEQ